MKPAAFQATYSDFKLVKTRKVAQFIFEVPIEGVDAALAVVGGMPDTGAERWFGIAPLREEAAKAPKEKQTWREMKPAQQSGIRCAEPMFWAYLIEQHNELIERKPQSADECADAVRSLCGVTSRSEFNTNHAARVMWFQLDEGFQAWKALEHA